MTHSITGQQVLAALMRDLEYTKQPEENRRALEQFILAVPEAIGEGLLSESATLTNIIKAKVAFLKYSLNHGLASVTAKLLIEALKRLKGEMSSRNLSFQSVVDEWQYVEKQSVLFLSF
jgi:hypothetical protein